VIEVLAYLAKINPDILLWARETAGFSAEEVALEIGFKDTKKLSAEEKYLQFESGKISPSWNQLERFSRFFKKPTTTFFLSRHPKPSNDTADFRTVADREPKMTLWLNALMQQMQARQQELQELLLDDNSPKIDFVGSISFDHSIQDAAAKVSEFLEFDSEVRAGCKSYAELFRYLRNQSEQAGVFVYLAGDLGSWHTKISAEIFRGFCLSDSIAPIVVLNNNDAKAAQNFTLIHELCHIGLGESVVSNSNPFSTEAATKDSEKFCNAVAAEFLLPEGDVREFYDEINQPSHGQTVDRIASKFNVSKAFTARRLHELNLISEDDWWELYNLYKLNWQQAREELAEKDGGPSYYVTTRSKLGDKTIKTVLNALAGGDLTYTRAARILGVKATSFTKLKEAVGW